MKYLILKAKSCLSITTKVWKKNDDKQQVIKYFLGLKLKYAFQFPTGYLGFSSFQKT